GDCMILPAARSLALKALQARLALKGLVGLAMFLFISGGVCSGLVFLSRTTSLLDPWLANRQHARVTSEQLRQAGLVPVATVQDVPADQAAVPGRSTSDPRFAFLLLGYGGIGHEGAYLTDSIVVAIANPEEKTIT